MVGWPAEEKFLAKLKGLKKATTSCVHTLTELALEDPKSHYKHVVGAICHRMRKTGPQNRSEHLVGRYLEWFLL